MSATQAAPVGRQLAFGDFVFDTTARKLIKAGVVQKVDPKPLELLEVFLGAPQKILTRDYLLDRVWGSRFVAESALSVVVAKLRKVLGRAPGDADYIENKYGQGYRFRLPIATLDAATLESFVAPVAEPTSWERTTVGRKDSLLRLQAATTRAKNGHGGFVALVGEPGIGKTHLAETLDRQARASGMLSAWGRLQATEALPALWPFAQILAEFRKGSETDEVVRVLREAASKHDDQAVPLIDRMSFDATSTSFNTINKIVDIIHRVSKAQPLLLFLDDLQWADGATLRTLNQLLSDIPNWPLLIVATVRHDELDLQLQREVELRRLLAHHNCERVELSRLSNADVAEYLHAMFGDTTPELCREVYTRSEGNPFFMVELLRPWADTSPPELAQLRLSDLALDIVRQRLRALPAAAVAVLSIASVVGRDFDLGLVGQVDGRGADEILETIDVALARGIVVESLEVHGAYAFDHELIREVLYTELPAAERCRLHRRIGEALERRRDAGVPVASAELANHFLRALPHGDVDHAIGLARAAATAAQRLCSHSEVKSLLLRALDASKFSATPNPKTVATLLLELAMVDRALGDASYVRHLQRAIEIARELGFGDLLAVAGRLLSPTPGLPGSEEAHHVLTSALTALPPEATDARASVLVHLAWTPPNCASASQVDALLAEAERLAQNSKNPDTIEVLLAAKLFFNSAPDRRDYAVQLADQLDRKLRANPALAQQGRLFAPWLYHVVSASQRGDKLEMRRILERRKTLAKLNNVELQWHQERIPLIMSMNRGEFGGLQEQFERLRERARHLELQSWRAVWGRDYGTFLTWTGDVSPFAARARPALRPSEHDIPMIRAHKIIRLAEYGFYDDVREALEAISGAWLQDLPHDREYIVVLADLARASAMVGHVARCRDLYELLQPYAGYYAASVSYHNDGSISHMLGLLARALGRDVDALARLEAALHYNTELELFACAVRSRFELAKLLLESKIVMDPVRGRRLLDLNYNEALTRGMKPLAEASRSLFKQTTPSDVVAHAST